MSEVIEGARKSAYAAARKALHKAGVTHRNVNGCHDVMNCQHCILLPQMYEAIATYAEAAIVESGWKHVMYDDVVAQLSVAREQHAKIAEAWTPDQWEIHPREDFARKEIAAAIRRA